MIKIEDTEGLWKLDRPMLQLNAKYEIITAELKTKPAQAHTLRSRQTGRST